MDYFFLNAVNSYRMSTEADVLKLRDKLKNLECGELVTFSYNLKEVKAKGEVIETYYVVKAKLEFNKEKDPMYDVSVEYSV